MTEKNPLMREWLEKLRRIKFRDSQKTWITAQKARINGEDRTRYACTIAKMGTIKTDINEEEKDAIFARDFSLSNLIFSLPRI